MRQPDITKKSIIESSSILFNTQGYQTTPLKDITDATKLTKGAIYKHFENKQDLELASFDHQALIIKGILIKKIKSAHNAGDKLIKVVEYFFDYTTSPPLEGGCPLLNTAIEVDESDGPLRLKAIQLYQTFMNTLVQIIENGKQRGQILPETDAQALASIIFCSLEGAIMTGRLNQNNQDMCHIVQHLTSIIHSVQIKSNPI